MSKSSSTNMEEEAFHNISELNSLISPCKKLKLGSSEDVPTTTAVATSATDHEASARQLDALDDTDLVGAEVGILATTSTRQNTIEKMEASIIDFTDDIVDLCSAEDAISDVAIQQDIVECNYGSGLETCLVDSFTHSSEKQPYFTTPLGTVYCMTGFELNTVPVPADCEITEMMEDKPDRSNIDNRKVNLTVGTHSQPCHDHLESVDNETVLNMLIPSSSGGKENVTISISETHFSHTTETVETSSKTVGENHEQKTECAITNLSHTCNSNIYQSNSVDSCKYTRAVEEASRADAVNQEFVPCERVISCPNNTCTLEEGIEVVSVCERQNTNFEEENTFQMSDSCLNLTGRTLNGNDASDAEDNDGSDSELDIDTEDKQDCQTTERAPVLVTDLDATLTDDKVEHVNEEDPCDEIDKVADAHTHITSVAVKPLWKESDSMNVTDTGSNCNSVPLCTSTPMVKFYFRTMQGDFNHEKLGNDDMNKYPTLTTFKPQGIRSDTVSSKPELVNGNSVPLCTSTPVVKPPLGLRMRDTNIMRDGNEVEGKKCVRIITDLQDGLSIIKADNETNNTESSRVHLKNDRNLKGKNKSENNDAVKSGTIKRDRDSKREKRKTKGTRIEKFKEYMGPGLTSNINAENELTVDSNKKDFVKNTDIETCTLTEYKGFGLTGPVPDKPLMTSTPAPPKILPVRNPNIMCNEIDNVNVKSMEQMMCPSIRDSKSSLASSMAPNPWTMPRCISGVSLGQRPAGTEGLILSNYGITTLRPQNSTVTLGGVSGINMCTPIQLNNQGPPLVHRPASGTHTGPPQGQLTAQSLTDHLASLSGQLNSGTSSALQPDEVYPSVTATSSSSRGDKSDNTSNADRSDKSEKFFDPKVLQCLGQLKVSAYMNFGLLTVHVVQGRQLSTKWKSACDSFVKMSLIPDDGKKPKCKTDVIRDSNNPLYDEKFSFELNDEDHSKRLMISVWHRDLNASVNEFLGCMSFGIRHLTNPKKEVGGWYYLLTEDIGRKKHLQVSHKQKPQLKVRNHSNIPSVNKDVWGTESLQLSLQRGKNGFGFSVVEACPVRVGRVDGASPAEVAGLQPGDIIIRLNKQNVSRSTATSVAKLVKHSSNTLVVEVQRPKPITFEQLENSPWKSNNAQSHLDGGVYGNDNYDDHTVPQMFTMHDDMKENEILVDEDTMYRLNPNMASLATSTPLPLLARGHRTVQTREMRKQESIHRLLSLELDFIDLMHSGMQRYSRPLRHCILSHSQHSTLFQNIEKLTMMSEYHVKQMHDNAPSSFVSEDTDTSAASDFVNSIGLIYQSKVHMLCQAYDLYAKGVGAANQVLSDLRRSEDFMKFVQDPPLEGNQPSISTFTFRPVQHIRDLYRVLQEIFLNTTQDSPDYNSLKQVVEGLQECANHITNYSCERVESVSSLASRDSKGSFTGSMKSKSSTCSSHSGSSKGHGHCSVPSCSLQTSKSVDAEVMKIQDRLVFSSNVPVFQLCQDDRHIIFSGDMFKWEGHQWMKIHVILFTDMLLQTVKESDGYFRVLHEPTILRDVVGMDAQRHHGTEFVLYCNNPRVTSGGRQTSKKLSLRAPSTEQKYAWKSLIEQRVFAVRGSLEYYSSTSDVSSSASAIII